MHVLVAEQDPTTREFLQEFLSRSGHEVTCVSDGERAWQLIEGDESFSLLITGWAMTRLDGMGLCRRVRSVERSRYLPIILLPSRAKKRDILRGLHAGADAFVAKPIDGAELLAQIEVATRILKLQERLETQLSDLSQAHDRLENHLRAAASVQQALLPSELPGIEGLDFAWDYEACEHVGGDMFNVMRLDEHRIGLYVLDVSGHGTSAALLSVSLSRILTPFNQQGGILKRSADRAPFYELLSPAEVAEELNRRFQLIQLSGQYFTFLYGVFDARTRELRYVRAGHPPPLRLSNGTPLLHDGAGDIPIGILEDSEYHEEKITLDRGDFVIFYTDGVNEARSSEGEEFGTDRMLEVLSDCQLRKSGIQDGIAQLRKSMEEFCRGTRQRDDITAVGFEIL